MKKLSIILAASLALSSPALALTHNDASDQGKAKSGENAQGVGANGVPGGLASGLAGGPSATGAAAAIAKGANADK